MALIGFARVSTQAQDLSIQMEALKAQGCVKIFQGKHSGKADTNKEALEELLEYVRSGDVVVVTKMDRLGRSLSQVLIVLDVLESKGVTLKAIDQGIDTAKGDPLSKAMVQAGTEHSFIIPRQAVSGGHFGSLFISNSLKNKGPFGPWAHLGSGPIWALCPFGSGPIWAQPI